MERIYVVSLVTAILLTTVEGQSVTDIKNLMSAKMANYNKYVRPVESQSQVLTVNVSLFLLNIIDFDEVKETLTFGAVLVLEWHDTSMEWDPESYGGVTYLKTSYKNVWVPVLILINPSDQVASLGSDWQQVRFDSSGMAEWSPGDIMTTTCTVDVTQFPFDTQRCRVDFLSWGYSQTEVVLIPNSDNVDLTFYSPNGAWTFVNGTAETIEFEDSSKFRGTFELARKPLFIVVNVLLPIAFLSFLNVLVFIIPVDSGERVSYCITVLLSIAVFFTNVSDTLPKSSEPMPIIAYILMMELIISSCITFFTILNLQLYFHDENDDVPAWMIKIVSCCRGVPRSCCKKTKGKEIDGSNVAMLSVNSSPEKTNGLEAPIQSIMVNEDGNTETLSNASWKMVSAFADSVFLIVFIVLNAAMFITFILVSKYY